MIGEVPAKIHRIKLSQDERSELKRLCRKAKTSVVKHKRATALLLCDEGSDGPAANDEEVMEATKLSRRSVERLRLRCCEVGPLAALERKPRDPSPPKVVTGEVEARITALACSEPPAGEARWSLRLLASHLVEIGVVESISHTTVGEVLKKVPSNPGASSAGASRRKRMPPS